MRVEAADGNRFAPEPGAFDRIVSVEMCEHVRNSSVLMRRIAAGLRQDGEPFVHVFSQGTLTYPCETSGASDWMARHFFSGGLMPSLDPLATSRTTWRSPSAGRSTAAIAPAPSRCGWRAWTRTAPPSALP